MTILSADDFSKNIFKIRVSTVEKQNGKTFKTVAKFAIPRIASDFKIKRSSN